MKVIITGATGMVGEGVLLECLQNELVTTLLMVNRRPSAITHPKLKELIVPDFFTIENYTNDLKGYDACFYCAGISSIGMNEEKYTRITYDTTLTFARTVVALNPNMVFNFISGNHTDSSEKGKIMWARVKGKTENALANLPFKANYNFRPGGMLPVKGQKNAKRSYVILVKIIKVFAPKIVIHLTELGQAMIYVVLNGYAKSTLEISDIKVIQHAKTNMQK